MKDKSEPSKKNENNSSGLSTDIPGKVSELELLLKKVLPRNVFWKIVLGKGLEFDGYRDYTSSDDASLIDWKASVRSKKTLVRKYVEERDKKFVFFIDVSDNMIFGSTSQLKCEYAAEVSAALAHLILSDGDKVGYALYNKKIVKSKKPEVGNRLFSGMVYELSDPENYGGISDLKKVMDVGLQMLESDTSLVFLVSDFVRFDQSYKKNLELLAGLVETVAIIVRDPLDNTFPDINKEVVIEDPETGERLIINPKVAKRTYEANAQEQLDNVKKVFDDLNIDFIELLTTDSFPEKIANFLRERISGGRVVSK
ncbi:DUF58 domain-containing protein [Candidatus Pacearchaeota archaeon]|nr:DUF58 domain-containing protein [Candidatus Pacearchaeota archaeon]MBD3283647.1 DUF58 domain-containing protein [Candidatus Pacearchaeota archaeon]